MTRRNGLRQLAALVPAVLAGLLLVAPAARATSGTWGAGGYPYLAGAVCTGAAGTSPLVSWNLGTGSPGFLVTPISSSGGVDSAVPPLPSVGAQASGPVTIGVAGFSSDADIATYAALLSGPGSSSDDAQVAAVAQLVLQHSGGGGVPGCAAGGAALLSQAAASAGPYTVSVAATPTPTVMGSPQTAVATVHGGQGGAVAGVRVQFSSSDARLATTSAVTDGSGQARATFTVPAGSADQQPTITATVTASVGLEEATVLANPSATDPTGNSVAAIYPAPPTVASSTANLSLDQTASPQLSAGGSASAVAVGGSVDPKAVVSGLRGHTGTLGFTIYGPESLDGTGGCAHAAPLTAQSPVAATSSQVQVVGDRTITATAWTPSKPGCYAIQAQLGTTDATPAASATSSLADPGAMVTVIAAAAQLTIAHPIVGVGQQSAVLHPAHTNGLAGTVHATLRGPVAPGADGSCAGASWSTAAPAAAVSAPGSAGDQPVTVRTAAIRKVGCYQWSATLALQVDGATVAVPAGTQSVLLLDPSVASSIDQSWSVSPHPVGTQVTVSGTYGLPAHVAIEMRFAPTSLTGCRGVSFAAAQLVSTGPAVAVQGSATTLAVPSGATPKNGCYQPVPVLRMDANPAIVVTGTLVSANALMAGVGVDQLSAPTSKHASSAGSSTRIWIVIGVAVLLQGLVVAGIAIFARRERSGGPPSTFLLD